MAILGAAKTDSFMLSTATVMLGLPEDLFNLSEANSIGLVKNFTIKSDPKYTPLTQGVKNTIVYSVMTGNEVMANMEVYEYTLANLSYALGLGAPQVAQTDLSDTVATALPNPTFPALTAATLVLTAGMALAADMYVGVQVGGDTFVRKVVSYTSGTKTVTLDAGFPAGVPALAKIQTLGAVGIGSKDEQPFLAAKIVGQLVNGDSVVILIPKVRIVKGFQLAFGSESYGNMPFEFSVFDLVNTDPNYAKFLPFGNAMLLA